MEKLLASLDTTADDTLHIAARHGIRWDGDG